MELWFSNFLNEGGRWRFWWVETCSTVLYGIEAMCL